MSQNHDRRSASVRELRVPPLAWTLAAVLAQRALPTRQPVTAARLLAATIGVASAGLGLAAAAAFARAGTTLDPTRPARADQLVVTGAHAVTRNPMYVAMVGALVAHAAWRSDPVALLPAAAVAVALDRFQIRPEERALSTLFGTDYDRYRTSVPRWL